MQGRLTGPTGNSMTNPEPEYDSAGANGVSAKEYLAILRRRRNLIFGVAGFFIIGAVAYIKLTPPVYQSQAQLLINPPISASASVNGSDPLAALLAPTMSQTIDTDVALLGAMPVLQEASKETGIDVRVLSGSTSATVVPDAQIVQITGSGPTGADAAKIANALTNSFLVVQQEQSTQALQNGYNFVKSQQEIALQKLHSAQQDLRNFQQSSGIGDIDHSRTDALGTVSTLTTAYESTLSQLAGTNSRLHAEQSLVNAEPAAQMVAVQQTNTVRNDIQQKIAGLQQQRANLLAPGQYTENAPQVKSVEAEIDEMKRQYNAQPALTTVQAGNVNALRQEIHAKIIDDKEQAAQLTAQAATLQNQLNAARDRAHTMPEIGLTYDRLNHAVQSSQSNYDTFTNDALNLKIRLQSYQPSASVLQAAYPMPFPVYPKKMTTLVFATLMGLAVGILWAMLREFGDDKLHSQADIARRLRLPIIGSLPALTDQSASRRIMPEPLLESFRYIRANLLLNSIDKPLRTVVITSPSSGEGKTTVATNLAYAMAETGRRTVLVDVNLRNPAIHQILETPPVPGLTEVLTDQAKLADVILEHEGMPNLLSITSGSLPMDPTNSLQSQAFDRLQARLMEISDIIIYDAPGTDAGADAQIIASKTDGVILVASMEQTSVTLLEKAVALLQNNRGNIIGLCSNKEVPQKKKLDKKRSASKPSLPMPLSNRSRTFVTLRDDNSAAVLTGGEKSRAMETSGVSSQDADGK